MKANKDREIQIKETDRYFVHVEHTRIINPGKHPEKVKRVQVYFQSEWRKHLLWIEKHGLKAMGDDEIRVVHDPKLQKEIEAEELKRIELETVRQEKAEAERIKKEAAAKKAREARAEAKEKKESKTPST